jgi:dTDP-4-dehydrorhamnose 3,5-epimerase
MEIRPTSLPDVIELLPKKIGDARGFFSETYSELTFARSGIDIHWVQDNQSYSAERHVLRGLHFQAAPYSQDKLVRVLRGAIFDVAVDIRKRSPTFGQWVGIEVSAARWNQLLIPKGFAHGFLTLVPETEVFYKVSAPYSAECDRAVRHDDPAFGVNWPLEGGSQSFPTKISARRTMPILAVHSASDRG